MSPRFAAPSTASISACATTSPSECPARPGSPGNSTPPSTSCFSSLNACASTPMPTRSSDTGEHRGQLVERRDLRPGPALQVAPRAAAYMHGEHPGRRSGPYVVVEPVADVGDLGRRPRRGLDQPAEELG